MARRLIFRDIWGFRSRRRGHAIRAVFIPESIHAVPADYGDAVGGSVEAWGGSISVGVAVLMDCICGICWSEGFKAHAAAVVESAADCVLIGGWGDSC